LIAADRSWCAAAASSKGGTTEYRRDAEPPAIASLIWVALAAGNSDHKSAIAPVTKGVATLVPASVTAPPSVPRLVTPSPGAPKPRLPIEPPRFDSFVGLPAKS
jgi:hypothetical protein